MTTSIENVRSTLLSFHKQLLNVIAPRAGLTSRQVGPRKLYDIEIVLRDSQVSPEEYVDSVYKFAKEGKVNVDFRDLFPQEFAPTVKDGQFMRVPLPREDWFSLRERWTWDIHTEDLTLDGGATFVVERETGVITIQPFYFYDFSQKQAANMVNYFIDWLSQSGFVVNPIGL